MYILMLLILLISAEVLVRLIVPEETFWPIHNIYRALDNREIGYTYKPNFRGTAFGVDLHTNSLGFRGPEWAMQKPDNTYRIALIGDSHAFAFGVPFKDSFGEVLAGILRERYKHLDLDFEVLNFAVDGYNIKQELAVLKEYVLRYAPDLVIAVPCSNDHEPEMTVDNEGWLRMKDPGGKVTGGFMDRAIHMVVPKKVSWLTTHSHFLLYMKFLVKKHRLAEEAQAKRHISSPKDRKKDWMGLFSLDKLDPFLQETVYLPLVENPEYRKLFAIVSLKTNVPSLELLSLFPEVKNAEEWNALFSLGWDGHSNAIAHKRYAVHLADMINTR
jgi:hypothetical protein